MQQEKAHFPRPDGLTRQLADPPRVTKTCDNDISHPPRFRRDEARPVPPTRPEDHPRNRQTPGANPRTGEPSEYRPDRLPGTGDPRVN